MELMIIMNNEMEREFLTHFYALSSDNQAYILALEQALLSKEQTSGNLPTPPFRKDNQVVQWTIK